MTATHLKQVAAACSRSHASFGLKSIVLLVSQMTTQINANKPTSRKYHSGSWMEDIFLKRLGFKSSCACDTDLVTAPKSFVVLPAWERRILLPMMAMRRRQNHKALRQIQYFALSTTTHHVVSICILSGCCIHALAGGCSIDWMHRNSAEGSTIPEGGKGQMDVPA